MIEIYPLLSLIAIIGLAIVINYRILLDRSLCLLLFLPMSFVWASAIGYGGEDFPTYLSYFGSYTIYSPFFQGSPFEFSVGVVSSVIKIFFSRPEDVALVYRILVFSLVPSAIICGSSEPKLRTARFCCFLFYVFLTPYTYLSASNIINNGFSIAFLTYAFVILIPVAYSCNLLGGDLTPPLSLLVALFLMLSAFAHPFGLSTIFVLLISYIVLVVLKKLGLLNYLRARSRMGRFVFFVVPVFFFVSVLTLSRVSSTDYDASLLVSSSLLLIVIICSRTHLYEYIKTSCVSICFTQSKKKSFTGLSNLIWMMLSSLSVFSIGLALIGGGDASERYIAFCLQSFLLYSIFLTVYLGPRMHFIERFDCGYSCKTRLPLRSSQYYVLPCYPLVFSIVMNAYFYSSDAFFANAL